MLYYSFGGNLVNAKQFRTELDLQSKEIMEIYDAPLLSAGPVDDIVVSRYADYLHALLPEKKLDLLVPIGASAVRLLDRYRSQLFPSTPVLAIAEGRRLPAALSENSAVITTSIDIAAIVDNILRVRPETNHIAVVIGNSPNERIWLKETQSAFQPFTTRVSFTYFSDLSLAEMLKRAASLPPRSAIFYFVLLTDAAGTTHEDVKVFSRFYAVANAPIFSYYDVNFGKGVVGGPLLSIEQRSRFAVGVALRILAGENPRDIQTPPIGFASPKYDWREMRRWGISENVLLPGSTIHFRELTAWERYRAQILMICAALLAQAMLIGWLIYEHRRRHRAEVIARNSMSELTHMNRLSMASELAASIAHEVNQPLTGITTRANAALRWLARETPNVDRAQQALTQIVAAGHRASDIITSIRAMFKKEGAKAAPVNINQLITSVLAIVQIDLLKNRIEVQPQLDELLPPVMGDKVQLQQVVLNLVMNAIEAMQSAQRRVLRVSTERRKPDVVHVAIEDTGIGVDLTNLDLVFKPLYTTKARGMGVGLSICRSIIESHYGRIWVTSALIKGSIFQFELPAYRRVGMRDDDDAATVAVSE